ncbi:hypothetical protein F383_29768 [Gossypium arboreum]|uniref:Uncharacterized protein n=1 Tax=Gossypium arboreum TaxID=29729 RepID=A0A0B0PKI1_GOSAR|nr:hypothetical protein F383_29768 [Gossypium arboreum]
MDWTSSHGRVTWPCPFGRIEARLTQVCHTGVSLPSPSIVLFGKGQFLGLLGIQKPILTPEQALRRGTQRKKQGITQGKPIDASQKLDSSSKLKISLQVPSGVFGILIQVNAPIQKRDRPCLKVKLS